MEDSRKEKSIASETRHDINDDLILVSEISRYRSLKVFRFNLLPSISELVSFFWDKCTIIGYMLAAAAPMSMFSKLLSSDVTSSINLFMGYCRVPENVFTDTQFKDLNVCGTCLYDDSNGRVRKSSASSFV